MQIKPLFGSSRYVPIAGDTTELQRRVGDPSFVKKYFLYGSVPVSTFCELGFASFVQVEGKHSSDICNLSNAILHCEALRTHTADAVGVDNVMTALVKRYFELYF